MSYIDGTMAISPRIKDRVGVDKIMLDVIVALCPALLMGTYLFGFRVLVQAAIGVLSSMGFEWLYCKGMKKPGTVGDLSACVTGLLLAMCLPVTAPYWAPVLGSAFAIVVVKQFYGGLGKNFMNPALAARMLLLSFPGMMTTFVDAMDRPGMLGQADAVSTATPMAYLHLGQLPKLTVRQMLLGQHGGAVGEVASLMLILGGVYLLCRRVISWRIPVSFVGTVAVITFLLPRGGVSGADWMLYNILSGGLLLGAIFMATDYATSPVTPRGQLIYGVLCGCLTVVLRYFGSYPDGVGFAILTANCCVWIMDRVGLPGRFGVGTRAAAGAWFGRQFARLSKLKPTLPKYTARQRGTMPGEGNLDSIRSWLRSGGVLAAFVVVTVMVIGLVYSLSGQTIVERENEQQQELLSHVMPQAEVATQTPYIAEDALSILAGYSGSELIGYCVEVEVQGFGGMITMVVGVDVNGEVTGVHVVSHSEHAGIGGRAMEEEYLSQYVGLSGTVRHEGRNAVDAVSGATDTSHAVTAGVNKALYIISHLDTGDVEFIDGEV